jgi:hypothetical protein
MQEPVAANHTIRNFLSWPQERHHITPVSPVRGTAKRLFIGSTPDGLPPAPVQPKVAPFVASFSNTSPYSSLFIDGFRCRLDHDPPIPSVSVAARSGPASPQTAASSDVLPPEKPVVASMFYQPSAGPFQPLLQAGQQPVLDSLGQRKPPPSTLNEELKES